MQTTRLTFCLGIAVLLFTPCVSGSAIERCTDAATGYINALDTDQRSRAIESFDSVERRKWAYLTGSKSRTHGLVLGDLSDRQKVLAHRLIACALSAQGYQKAAGIIRLDDRVRERMDALIFPLTSDFEIGRDFYWLGVFGKPGGDNPWGWQIEGHHLALNFTVVGDSISVTPAFMGADPAEVQTGPLAGWRLLGREEDLAFDLIRNLNEQQRSRAVLSAVVPKGLFTSPGRGSVLTAFEGLPAADMTARQRQLLWLLIGEYVQNADPRGGGSDDRTDSEQGFRISLFRVDGADHRRERRLLPDSRARYIDRVRSRDERSCSETRSRPESYSQRYANPGR